MPIGPLRPSVGMLRALGGGSRRLGRFLSAAWVAAGIVTLVVAAAFLAWRIPGEREERRVFEQLVERGDGPHVLWLDERTFKVIRVRYDRASARYAVHEDVCSLQDPAGLPQEVRQLLDEAPDDGIAEYPDARVAVLSDVHGEHRQLRTLLQKAGVIDAQDHWTWGDGQLVVAGDVFDKGPAVTESLWLLRRLERQARDAGGRVHVLLGNHDHLALTGSSNVVHPKYLALARELRLSQADLFGPASELGRWLRRRSSVVKIGPRLYVHAGLSEAVLRSGLSLSEINRLLRATLDPVRMAALPQRDRDTAALLSGAEGPLWARGYFDDSFPLGWVGRVRGRLRGTARGRILVAEKAGDWRVIGPQGGNVPLAGS